MQINYGKVVIFFGYVFYILFGNIWKHMNLENSMKFRNDKHDDEQYM